MRALAFPSLSLDILVPVGNWGKNVIMCLCAYSQRPNIQPHKQVRAKYSQDFAFGLFISDPLVNQHATISYFISNNFQHLLFSND